MALKVNQELCIGCGACVSLCPETFLLNDEGKSQVITQENIDCARNAAAGCPVQAISVE